METISKNQIQTVWQRACADGLIDTQDSAVIFLNLSVIQDRVSRIARSFPEDSLHAVAIKTNPLTSVLKSLNELGCGLEAASMQEVHLAIHAGAEPEKIVFDSPAKTAGEIDELQTNHPGLRVNCDSLAELQRFNKSKTGLKLGLRINPLITSDSIGYMNVGGAKSKFGEPISHRQPIVDACLSWQDLDCLHIHIGSQFSDFQPTIDAVNSVTELAQEINQQAGQQKIKVLNLGGGFPVNYKHDEDPFHIEPFVATLREKAAGAFSGEYKILTEFGRYVHANAGWCVSRIEYIKQTSSVTNLVTHVGADMFLRECYNPGDWHHEMFVMGADGSVKAKAETLPFDVAGPLCFGGDFVRKQVSLQRPQVGDCLVIQDVGANTFSLWSRHCSRPFPKVVAYRCEGTDNPPCDLQIAKKRETIQSILNFWS